MRRVRLSAARKFVLWYFDEPSNDPYVSLSFDIAIKPALDFIDAFEREHGERVGLQHLVTKAAALCMRELPAVNVKIFDRRIYQLDRVDIAVPVHLGATQVGNDETGMMILRHVDQKSLLEVARQTRKGAQAERLGSAHPEGTATVRRLGRMAPAALVYRALDLGSALLGRPATYRLLESRFGVSSAVTNVGSVFLLPEGARFRAGSATISTKMGPVATLFGIGPAEDAVVAEGGAPSVRRVLPIVMIVDHRAVDGVLMSAVAANIARSLAEPSRLVSPVRL